MVHIYIKAFVHVFSESSWVLWSRHLNYVYKNCYNVFWNVSFERTKSCSL